MNIITVLVTAAAVWHLIGNFSPVRQPQPPFPFFLVVFQVFSLGLDVSNLPLRNPQQRNKWFCWKAAHWVKECVILCSAAVATAAAAAD